MSQLVFEVTDAPVAFDLVFLTRPDADSAAPRRAALSGAQRLGAQARRAASSHALAAEVHPAPLPSR